MGPQPRKGQTSLDFLMTYGWAVLLVVVVVASLFALGVFNAGSFLGPRATGFAQIGVIAWNVNAAGILSLRLQNFAGMNINVVNIEATYGTSHFPYDIINVSIPDSKISDTFTVGAISGLAPGQYYTMPLRITYTDLNGFNYTETGTISGTVGAGAVPPSIRINSPHSDSLLNNRTINISVSVWGGNLSYTDIMIIDESGAPVNVTTNSQLGTYSVLLDVQADGVYNITALANYTDGGSASATASNITVNTTGALSCVQPPSGLVTWWPGENNASDIIGMNNGTWSGTPAYPPGEVGQAFGFDGSNGYVDIPSAAVLNSYPLTVDFWMKTTTTANNNPGVINKYISSSFNGWQVYMQNGEICYWYFADSSNNVYGGNCVPGYNEGQWHNVAFVVDAAGGSLYVDGSLQSNTGWTGTPGPTTTTVDLSIGQYTGVIFDGSMDEVQIYDRVLSQPEIQAIYDAGSAGMCGPAPSVQQSGCGTISSPGDYALAGDVSNDSTCLTIAADNVTLDCKGHSITGSGSGSGVNNTGHSYVTVKNCIITGFGNGIDFQNGASHGTIENNTANGNYNGININSSSYNTLASNTAAGNYNGIYSSSSNDSTLISNHVGSNGFGITLTSCSGNVLDNNSAIGQSNGFGIYLISSSGNNITRSATSWNDYGVWLSSSPGNILTNNNISSNYQVGLILSSSASNTLYNNLFNNYANIGVDSPNVWNTTQAAGPNIIGSGDIGGNYYSDPYGTGFSETCTDGNSDGICDGGFTIGTGNLDELPLATPPLQCDHLDSPDTVYTLTQPPAPGECFDILADNVTLDCNGYSIAGTSMTGAGVSNRGYDLATVKGCDITGFARGILFGNGSTGGTITNNTVHSNKVGIHIASSSGNEISSNTANSNTGDGIYLDSGSGNTLASNTAYGDSNGIHLSSSDGNILDSNNAGSEYSTGIVLAASSNNTLYNNSAIGSSNGFGIHLVSSSGNNITRSTTSWNDYGIRLDSSPGGVLAGNNISLNYQYGLILYSSASNTIYDNILNNSNNLYVDSPSYWNTTLNCSLGSGVTNIIGGPCIGGNYWADPTGTGFSENCTTNGSSNSSGICTVPYDILGDGSNVDGLPLTTNFTANLLVSITSPLNDSALDNRTITINFTASGTNLDHVNISVYDSSDGLVNSTTRTSPTVSEIPDYGFESGTVGSCPPDWACTGAAVTADQGCFGGAGIEGSKYGEAGCDWTTGTFTSDTFVLPFGSDHLRFLRAGGADAPSGVFVKRASDDALLCSSTNGADTNLFFEDNCSGLSPYAGESVYIYVDDETLSGWGKVGVDDFHVQDSSNNNLLVPNGLPGGSYTIQLSVPSDGAYNITATAYDNSGNNASSMAGNVTVNSPPILLSNCGNISYPGNYVLTGDVSNSGTCFTIGADHVTLDCNGSTITGPGSSDNGIYNNGHNYVTVKNCNITGFGIGIYFDNDASHGTIRNNTASSNGYEGIRLVSGSNNTITDNTFNSEGWEGIWLDSSSFNTITNNTANSNIGGHCGSGICLSSSDNNIIAGNTVDSNGGGIGLGSSSNNIIANNTARLDRTGIGLDSGSSNNTVINNTASNNSDQGIALGSSSDNTVANNTANSNNQGIRIVSSSNNNTIYNNTASFDYTGIYIESTFNNAIANNIATNNNGSGIQFSSSNGNTIANNTISGNGGNGIQFYSSNSSIIANNAVTNNSGNGIWFYILNNNNTIADNNLSNNHWTGVYLQSNNNNNTITGNIAISNNDGIGLSDSYDNTVSNNTAISNSGTGIGLGGGSHNTITNNTASLNSRGINIDYSSSYNTVSNNTVNSNSDVGHPGYGQGIAIWGCSSNIIADNTISNNSQQAIVLSSSSNNTIYNNTANNNSGNGINLGSNSNNNTIADNTARSNQNGIVLWSSSNNTIHTNTASNNSNYGIFLDSGSNNNTIADNTASSNQYGIHLDSRNNTIANNNAILNSGVGIRLSGGSNNTINNNNASSNEYGIRLESSSNYNIIFNNTVSNNTGIWNSAGVILVSGSNYNTIANNTAISNSAVGIELESSSNNTIIANNTASSNGWDGIQLWSSSNDIVTNNIVSNNTRGIELYSSSGNNTVTSNIIANNSDHGIHIESSSNNNIIYNNFLNNSADAYSDSPNNWNATLSCSGPHNIIGGNCIGGNYYATPSGNGWSQNQSVCNSNSSGLCTWQYNISTNNIDYLPLTNLTPLPIKLSSCGNISYPGSYILSGGPYGYGSGNHCFDIYASNVTLDCNGSTLSGTGNSGMGIYDGGYNYVTVKNCIVTHYWDAIYFSGASFGTIFNNTVSSNGQRSIAITAHSNNNIVANNTDNSNGESGIQIETSSNNIVANNSFSSNSLAGIDFFSDSGSNNTIYNNFLNNTNDVAFRGTVHSNRWNTTRTTGPNIVGSGDIGGNFWANPSGNGISQTCTDTSPHDGICDSPQSQVPYPIPGSSSDYDYLPLAP